MSNMHEQSVESSFRNGRKTRKLSKICAKIIIPFGFHGRFPKQIVSNILVIKYANSFRRKFRLIASQKFDAPITYT